MTLTVSDFIEHDKILSTRKRPKRKQAKKREGIDGDKFIRRSASLALVGLLVYAIEQGAIMMLILLLALYSTASICAVAWLAADPIRRRAALIFVRNIKSWWRTAQRMAKEGP